MTSSTGPWPGIDMNSTTNPDQGPVGPDVRKAAQRATRRLVPDVPPGDDLGGKGRALAELITVGFPVPTTGVVTTNAYRAIANDEETINLIGRIADGGQVPADDVDQVFLDAELDPDLQREITDLARSIGDGGPIAVRSSATVEDLHGSSFAGQYQSLLNVDSSDQDSVMQAVRRVWASLWHPAPSAYRRAFGIDEADVAMAVVLMEMIPATSAGVVFTADPGGSSGARVEAVQGLGEALVSGERTPEAWVVPTGEPSTGLPAAAAGALDLALAVEAAFGAPQDVEWAAVEDDVSIVQARPITVLEEGDGFDTAIDDHELTTGGIVEIVPGVLPPLLWEVNRFILDEAFRSVLDSLGLIRGVAAEDHRFVRRVRGRAAIDFDQLRAVTADIPGAVEELERQYFGEQSTTPGPSTPPRRRRRALFASLQRDILTLQTQRKMVDQSDVLVEVAMQLRRRRPDLAGQDEGRLLGYARRLVDLSARGLAAELAVAAAAGASFRRLELALTKHLGASEAERAAQAVTVGGVNVVPSPRASAAVFAGPTWTEQGLTPPSPPTGGTTHAERLTALEKRLTSLPHWKRQRIMTGQIIDARIHIVRRVATDVVEQLHRREAAKAAVLELGGELRRVHMALGSALTSKGILERAEDVELLGSAELAAACTGKPDVRPDVIRRRRNWIRRYEVEGPLPVRFVGTPDRTEEPLPEGDVLNGWGASPGRIRGRGSGTPLPHRPTGAGRGHRGRSDRRLVVSAVHPGRRRHPRAGRPTLPCRHPRS